MPTAAGQRLPRAEREQQLLDVAEELFTSRGFADTSVEDIARGAGVTRPIVYELHGNKEAVFLACVSRGRAALDQAIVAAVAGTTDPREQLVRGMDVYYRVLEQDPRRWDLLFGPCGPIVGSLGSELTVHRLRTVRLIAGLIQAHAPAAERDDVEIWAHAVSGSAEQIGRWWVTRPEVAREHVVQRMVDVAWLGLVKLIEPTRQ